MVASYVLMKLNDRLHPYLTKHIIDLFCDTDINKGQAQLIFTSHDISLLHRRTLKPETSVLYE